MLKHLAAVALLGSALAFSGCETLPTPGATVETANLVQLQNRTWIVTQIGNTAVRTEPTAHNIPSLQFDSATQRVSGADGCNRIMGSYSAGRDTLLSLIHI